MARPTGNHALVRAAGFRLLVLTGITSLAFTSCSSTMGRSARDPTTSETTVKSFACIEAVAMTALTTGSSVGQARTNLQRLAHDSTLSEEERAYFADLLSAIAKKADDETVGNALDGVPCHLK
jgi:hypothetical protein